MTFSSAIFLFVFLPITFLLYLLVPGRTIKNYILIAASLIFYAFGEPVYVLLMIFSVIVNFLLGLLVGRKKSAKLFLIISVIFNISILVVFKYTDFLLSNFNRIIGTSIPLPHISLPIGISFFTFQAMSYVIDVYRNPQICQRKFSNLLLYVSFFPQLIAGPIVRYEDIQAEIDNRQMSMEEIAAGTRRFIFGLAKKMIAANTLGAAATKIFTEIDSSHYNFVTCWLGAVFYTLQIYYDFSGYSDMAIGLGRVFGFHFRENFNYPFASDSIKDFWRRWHISLSSWFKSYVYIPLGGNRKGHFRMMINKYIVFFLTGFWHGAGWNFIIWGLIHGTALSAEDSIKRKLNLPSKGGILGRTYTMIIVIIAFVFFNCETFAQATEYLRYMFTGFDFTGIGKVTPIFTPWFIFVLLFAVIFSAPVVKLMQTKITSLQSKSLVTACEIVSYTAAFLLLIFCIFALPSTDYNPFIYFRF